MSRVSSRWLAAPQSSDLASAALSSRRRVAMRGGGVGWGMAEIKLWNYLARVTTHPHHFINLSSHWACRLPLSPWPTLLLESSYSPISNLHASPAHGGLAATTTTPVALLPFPARNGSCYLLVKELQTTQPSRREKTTRSTCMNVQRTSLRSNQKSREIDARACMHTQ